MAKFPALHFAGGALAAAILATSCASKESAYIKQLASIETRSYLDQGELVVVHTVPAGSMSGYLFSHRINGIEQGTGIQAGPGDLEEKATHWTAECRLTPRAGEYTVSTVWRPGFEKKDGKAIVSHYRVFGQELTAKPPTVDGVITSEDWNDPALVSIIPSKQVAEDYPKHQCPCNDEATEEKFSATARAVWTEDALWLGFEVVDSTEHSDSFYPYFADDMSRTPFNDLIQIQIATPDSYPTTLLISVDGGFEKANGFAVRMQPALHSGDSNVIDVASTRTENGYAVEARIDQSLLGFAIKPDTLLDFQMKVFNEGNMLKWQPGEKSGLAIILPDPAGQPAGPKRQQLHAGETKLNISEAATKDPAYQTPLPVEFPGATTNKPQWLDLKLPWEGTRTIATGYGFESKSWTHQTIANMNSANDFFAIDIDMPIGTPILAAANGRIAQSGLRGDSYGNYIVMDHGDGVQTIYAHLSELQYQVDKGEPEMTVRQGQFLGLSGQSGTSFPHLHFGVHTGARASHSGANVGGLATLPEPISGYYGIRKGQQLVSDNKRID